MAVYAIGDIHGHSSLLSKLLSAVSIADGDTLVFTGDYVDKGPDVKGTIDLLLHLTASHEVVFLRGNHDQSFLDAFVDPDKIDIWACLAGNSPLASYGEGNVEDVLPNIPDSHISFLKDSCVDYFETDRFIFVHAGIRPHLTPSEEDVERLHWSSLSLAQPHISGKTVICGHSAQSSGKIADLGHTICIDTGVTKDQYLTCLNLEDFSYTQVSHDLDVYESVLSSR